MKKETQLSWVKSQLRENGEITRNTALQHYVSRLSALIQRLEGEGYEFEAFGRDSDYVYRVKTAPKKMVPKYEPIIENGRQVGMRKVASYVEV